jgi:hypothetical protein
VRIIDFDPEFLWSAGEPFPAALIARGRWHAMCCNGEFVGTVTQWDTGRGILFAVLGCAVCGLEIGRGLVWRESPSDDAYPWQAGYWARVERGVA